MLASDSADSRIGITLNQWLKRGRAAYASLLNHNVSRRNRSVSSLIQFAKSPKPAFPGDCGARQLVRLLVGEDEPVPRIADSERTPRRASAGTDSLIRSLNQYLRTATASPRSELPCRPRIMKGEASPAWSAAGSGNLTDEHLAGPVTAARRARRSIRSRPRTGIADHSADARCWPSGRCSACTARYRALGGNNRMRL